MVQIYGIYQANTKRKKEKINIQMWDRNNKVREQSPTKTKLWLLTTELG